MSGHALPSLGSLSESAVLRVDRTCLRFEAALKAGNRPRLEDYLGDTSGAERTVLLQELLLLELDHRSQKGEPWGPDEYRGRFPEDVQVLGAVFRRMAPSAPPLLGPDAPCVGTPPATAGGAQVPLTPGTPPALPGGMRVTLTVTAGPHKGQVFPFAGHDTFLVGRSKRAHFRLSGKDQYFSRIHFMVEVNPPHCRLLDMDSRNGTCVNGARVGTTDLKDGDQIRAGRTILRVTIEGGAAARAPLPETLPATPAVAPQIPGYDILEQLGRGGMGVVYKARRREDGTLVALKTITPSVKGTRREIDYFLREAQILRQLDHPNIVAFHEIGEADGRLYFAMEYVPGTDAARLLEEVGPLPVGRAVRMVCQLLQALDYAHAKGFVHRDIKPANVLLEQGGGRDLVKLADFGLARVYQASKLSGLTMTGDVGGTVAFMAPEQITNFRDAQPPADQYSAAATLYKLLTGRDVYDLPRAVQKALLVIIQEEAVPVQAHRPEVPEGLAAVIHRALAKDPQARFADARELHRALSRYAR
jgi:serine/threonine-protein kinase